MPLSGTGSYSAPASSWNPAVDTTDISSTDWIALLADISTALSTAVYKDGQQTTTAPIPFAQGVTLSGASTVGATATLTAHAGVGAGTILPSGQLNAQTSAAGIGNGADATDDTLFTYSLPLNSLSDDGKAVEMEATGLCANNGNLKTVKVWFAGGSLTFFAAAAQAGLTWIARLKAIRINSTHVSLSGVLFGESGGAWVAGTAITPNLVVADLTANASIIKVTGKSAASAANDVLGYSMTVTFSN